LADAELIGELNSLGRTSSAFQSPSMILCRIKPLTWA
jgi:hypothetical protein